MHPSALSITRSPSTFQLELANWVKVIHPTGPCPTEHCREGTISAPTTTADPVPQRVPLTATSRSCSV